MPLAARRPPPLPLAAAEGGGGGGRRQAAAGSGGRRQVATDINVTMAQQCWCYLERLEDKHHAALIFAAATMGHLVVLTARGTISAQVNFA